MDRYFRSLARRYGFGWGALRFNPSFMDRYFRSITFFRVEFGLCIVSIHLLWTGTLEALEKSGLQYAIHWFQSIFYGQVL